MPPCVIRDVPLCHSLCKARVGHANAAPRSLTDPTLTQPLAHLAAWRPLAVQSNPLIQDSCLPKDHLVSASVEVVHLPQDYPIAGLRGQMGVRARRFIPKYHVLGPYRAYCMAQKHYEHQLLNE